MQNSGHSSGGSDEIRGRGRPRGFDRAAALAAATRLFWQKGFEATSIADLTAAMGIGSPSLYAAFGSKEGLYTEALRHYCENYDALVWNGFRTAASGREAVARYLLDSAAALTGCTADNPLGCMVTLSSVGSEDHAELGERMRVARSVTRDRLLERLTHAAETGELPADADLSALARFFQTVQAGMSILARDGASRAELDAVAQRALCAWDAAGGSTGGEGA